jgi:hypothetical protein
MTAAAIRRTAAATATHAYRLGMPVLRGVA